MIRTLSTPRYLRSIYGGASVIRRTFISDTGSATDKKTLMIGSGLCCPPIVDYLTQFESNKIFIASRNETSARDLCGTNESVQWIPCAVTDESANSELDHLLRDQHFDLVISMLPNTMHDIIAELCLKHEIDFISPSYMSDDMKAMHQRAQDNKVTFVTEIGIDPGIDQFAARRLINTAHSNNETVTSFFSSCGGIPSPLSNNNPFGYKFSFSPIGLLRKCQLNAKYLKNDEIMDIAGSELLDSVIPFNQKLLEDDDSEFEVVPNRDATKYIYDYGLNPDTCSSIFRGNFRYKGFCKLMSGFKLMGLLDTFEFTNEPNERWMHYIHRLLNGSDALDTMKKIEALLLYNAWDSNDIQLLFDALQWLNIENEKLSQIHENPRSAFCELLSPKLCFFENEHDMIALYHEITTVCADGEHKKYTNSLVVYGDDEYSAMARTTGIPVAVIAQLMLNGVFREKECFGIVTCCHELLQQYDVLTECEPYKINVNSTCTSAKLA